MPAIRTGWGLDSTNTRYPPSKALRTARSNCTGWRMLRYQYSAFTPAVSMSSPVTVEKNATVEVRGSIPRSAAMSSFRIASTCAECDA
ncbi:Uncharacterised protein [Mycobacterium tuberculosis]|nr:Uncharacterised protein [Mycobacterium tuberculosis]